MRSDLPAQACCLTEHWILAKYHLKSGLWAYEFSSFWSLGMNSMLSNHLHQTFLWTPGRPANFKWSIGQLLQYSYFWTRNDDSFYRHNYGIFGHWLVSDDACWWSSIPWRIKDSNFTLTSAALWLSLLHGGILLASWLHGIRTSTSFDWQLQCNLS